MTVKVNTVLIPGINDGEVGLVARKVKELGVFVMNVMPLIPQADFARVIPPTPTQIEAVRSANERIIGQFRHCRQCRADAVGSSASRLWPRYDMHYPTIETRSRILAERRYAMPKYKETPRYNVISMRVSEDERKSLQQLATQNALSISELMRMAMKVLTFENSALGMGRRMT